MHPELLGQLASQHADEIRTSARSCRPHAHRAARRGPLRDHAGRVFATIRLLLASELGDAPAWGPARPPAGERWRAKAAGRSSGLV